MVVTKVFSRQINSVKDKIWEIICAIRDELDDHLDAINQNTNEMQSNYEYLCELDSKIEKLNERLDKVQMMVEPQPTVSDIILTKREQDVFFILYNTNDKIKPEDIAKKTGLTVPMINKHVTNLVYKGIPILKYVSDNDFFFEIDPNFRDIQSKKGIVNLNI
ncbi:hypothetical protein JW949_01795 [Candidatus Woesearchaeota archaeon]|nr:hypothetical protein [Candidatus Woesearchaeota archaeon]